MKKMDGNLKIAAVSFVTIIFSQFLMGIVYGYFYIITGSLYTSIGLHFATDFFYNISSNCLLYFDVKNNYYNMFVFTEISVSLIMILCLALYRYKNKKIMPNEPKIITTKS